MLAYINVDHKQRLLHKGALKAMVPVNHVSPVHKVWLLSVLVRIVAIVRKFAQIVRAKTATTCSNL